MRQWRHGSSRCDESLAAHAGNSRSGMQLHQIERVTRCQFHRRLTDEEDRSSHHSRPPACCRLGRRPEQQRLGARRRSPRRHVERVQRVRRRADFPGYRHGCDPHHGHRGGHRRRQRQRLSFAVIVRQSSPPSRQRRGLCFSRRLAQDLVLHRVKILMWACARRPTRHWMQHNHA